MLGRHLIRDPRPHRRTADQGLGATRMEWANRIRWGGFTVAGIALTIAGLIAFGPLIAKKVGIKIATKKGIAAAKKAAAKRKKEKD